MFVSIDMFVAECVPKFPQPPYPTPKWGWEEIGEKYPFAEMGITNELIRASIPSEENEQEKLMMLVMRLSAMRISSTSKLTRLCLSYPRPALAFLSALFVTMAKLWSPMN